MGECSKAGERVSKTFCVGSIPTTHAFLGVFMSIDWTRVDDKLPENNDGEFIICHYNDFTEIARFEDGDWFRISGKFSEEAEKLIKESQPEFWSLITYQERKSYARY